MLTKINNLKKVDKNAFKGAKNLQKVIIKGTKKGTKIAIVTLDKNILKGLTSLPSAIRISIERMDLGKSFDRVFLQPGFCGIKRPPFMKSYLEGEVDWKSCPKNCAGNINS